MPQVLTIRCDDDLEQAIEREAQSQGVSRNGAALRLLRLGAGLPETQPRQETIGNSLDWFIGSWTEEEFLQFEETTKSLEHADLVSFDPHSEQEGELAWKRPSRREGSTSDRCSMPRCLA